MRRFLVTIGRGQGGKFGVMRARRDFKRLQERGYNLDQIQEMSDEYLEAYLKNFNKSYRREWHNLIKK